MSMGISHLLQKEPGYWKCNTNILKNKMFLPKFQKLWAELLSIQPHDQELWKMCKIEFKKLILSTSKKSTS